MDKELTHQLDRLEAAFSTLIDSITTYNPFVAAADELLEADDRFNVALKKPEHQSNYIRLQTLRQTAATLDAQIKSSVSKLAEARKELLDLPWSDPVQIVEGVDTPIKDEDGESAELKILAKTGGVRKLPMTQLLAYAQKISRTSLPPGYRRQFAVPERPSTGTAPTPVAVVTTEQDTMMTNGVESQNISASDTPMKVAEGAEETATKMQEEQQEEDRGSAWETLPPDRKAWLDELKHQPFVPWPHEDLLKTGALASLQRAVERGEDPWTLDVTAATETSAGVNGDSIEGHDHVDGRGGREGLAGNGGDARTSGQRAPQEEEPSRFMGLGMYDPEADEE